MPATRPSAARTRVDLPRRQATEPARLTPRPDRGSAHVSFRPSSWNDRSDPRNFRGLRKNDDFPQTRDDRVRHHFWNGTRTRIADGLCRGIDEFVVRADAAGLEYPMQSGPAEAAGVLVILEDLGHEHR